MKEGSWPTCRLFRWPNFFPLSQIWNDSRLLRSIIFCRPHRVIGRQTLSESVKLATERPLFHQSTSHQYLSRKYLKYDTWYKIYYVAIKLPLFNTYHTRLLINLLWSSHFRKLQKTAPIKELQQQIVRFSINFLCSIFLHIALMESQREDRVSHLDICQILYICSICHRWPPLL